MLVGMPTKYHVSCIVRSVTDVEDTPHEHADTTIDCTGTVFTAFTQWLLSKDSWLTATPQAIQTIADMLNQPAENGKSELETFGWSSIDNGGMTDNEWDITDFEINNDKHTLVVDGIGCEGEFSFKLTIKPVYE